MKALYRLIYIIKKKIYSIINRIIFACHHLQIGKNAQLYGVLTISGQNGIRIGNDFKANAGKDYNKIGGDTRLLLRTGNGGYILIHNNVGISNSTIVSLGEGIEIENDVMIGGSCKIYDTDFHSIDYENRMKYPDPSIKSKKVTICEGAFIGAHSIILKGVRIGKYSVVGAGSVITRDIPDGEVWGGNPAKFIKRI